MITAGTGAQRRKLLEGKRDGQVTSSSLSSFLNSTFQSCKGYKKVKTVSHKSKIGFKNRAQKKTDSPILFSIPQFSSQCTRYSYDNKEK